MDQQNGHPPHRHLIAGVGWLAVAFLFFGNDDNFAKATEVLRTVVSTSGLVPAGISATLPTSGAGWITVLAVVLGGMYQLLRARRAADVEDARADARLDAMERRVVAIAAAHAAHGTADSLGGASSPSGAATAAAPCSDPSCFRCRPASHAEAMARHSARLLKLTRGGGAGSGSGSDGGAVPSLRGVSDDIVELARSHAGVTRDRDRDDASALATRSGRVMKEEESLEPASLSSSSSSSSSSLRRHPLQAPTVFRLPSLPAIPVHRRFGRGCCNSGGGNNAAAAAGAAKKERERERGEDGCRCWCAELWRENTGDLWKLERACGAVRAELDRAIERGGGRGSGGGGGGGGGFGFAGFAPFDPSVHRGGEWSAVYLWRNGVRDDANCHAFPAAAAVVDSLAHAAYLNSGIGGGIGGGGGGDEGGEEAPPPGGGGCAFGSAYLSRLTPGTTVTPHCGPCNARLRCHLALRVPGGSGGGSGGGGGGGGGRGVSGSGSESGSGSGSGEHEPPPPTCELIVAGRSVTWREGEALLFDDSFEHSATYRFGGGSSVEGGGGGGGGGGVGVKGGGGGGGGDATSSSSLDSLQAPRVVLVVDLWHPMLSAADRAALSVLYPPGM